MPKNKVVTAVTLGLALLAGAARANPYFRPIDPAHPVKVAGAFIDPAHPGNTSVGTSLALVTHSTRDGCLLPSIVCEDWSPLMAGLSVNAGRVQFAFGPAANLTPAAKLGLWKLLDLTTAPQTLSGLKSALSSQPVSGPDVSVSFGPALAVSPIERGVFLPVTEWRGRFRVFAGAELKF